MLDININLDNTPYDPSKDLIFGLIQKENLRQKSVLRLIPSENYVSKEVSLALSSCLSNKYSEGYKGKRYYQGQEFVDEVEGLAISRAKDVFKVPHVNVQAYSGSIANAAVYFALLAPGDTIMGMSLDSGGHLTHGFPKITFSGKYFNSVSYTVGENGLLDYDKIRFLALKHRPKLIISGASAYPRIIDFEKIGQISMEVSAYHMADISHIAGLVATGLHPSPMDFADIVTSTTHKTLRGPKGALIMVTEKGLSKDAELSTKIDKAVFPGMQGGPHMNNIAGIAVALAEALSDDFSTYINQVVLNAKALANNLSYLGFSLVTGRTDNHLVLIDVRNKNMDGWLLAWALEYAGIIVNRNAIPFDPNPPYYPSGIRLGTPAITSIGLKEKDMEKVAQWLDAVTKIVQTYLSNEVKVQNVSLEKIDKSVRQELKSKFSKDPKLLAISQEVKAFVHGIISHDAF